METKTYLIKTDYDYKTKQVIQIDGNTLTIQFRIMDNYSMLEIKGRLKDRGIEEFTHQILCHKDQDLTILPTVNDQIDHVDNMESVYKDRISIDRGHDIISSNDLGFNNDKKQEPIIGLHGQLDLEDAIASKKGGSINE